MQTSNAILPTYKLKSLCVVSKNATTTKNLKPIRLNNRYKQFTRKSYVVRVVYVVGEEPVRGIDSTGKFSLSDEMTRDVAAVTSLDNTLSITERQRQEKLGRKCGTSRHRNDQSCCRRITSVSVLEVQRLKAQIALNGTAV